jgi:hypothetical protein
MELFENPLANPLDLQPEDLDSFKDTIFSFVDAIYNSES